MKRFEISLKLIPMPANYLTSWLTDCPLSADVGFVLHMWSPVVLATKH